MGLLRLAPCPSYHVVSLLCPPGPHQGHKGWVLVTPLSPLRRGVTTLIPLAGALLGHGSSWNLPGTSFWLRAGFVDISVSMVGAMSRGCPAIPGGDLGCRAKAEATAQLLVPLIPDDFTSAAEGLGSWDSQGSLLTPLVSSFNPHQTSEAGTALHFAGI